MKKSILSALALIAIATSAISQNINLPAPQTTGGLPVNQTLAQRHSTRQFDPAKHIPAQTVSNLLWAACGINRPETGMRTNPTARNFQEIEVYWFDKDGVYLYHPAENSLVEVAKGDYRHLIAGGQDFVNRAPASILIVADTSKAGLTASLIDAGIACENINLFCAGNNIATVPRMTMDAAAITKLLSLPETKQPVLNNPVGFPE